MEWSKFKAFLSRSRANTQNLKKKTENERRRQNLLDQIRMVEHTDFDDAELKDALLWALKKRLGKIGGHGQ